MAAKSPAAPAPTTTTSAWVSDMANTAAAACEGQRELANDRWQGVPLSWSKSRLSCDRIQFTRQDEINPWASSIVGVPSISGSTG